MNLGVQIPSYIVVLDGISNLDKCFYFVSFTENGCSFELFFSISLGY